MTHSMRTRRRLLVLGGLAALMLAALGGTALAALGETVKTYTGCLITSSGNLTKLKEGNTPLGSPCASGSVPIRVSSGDITSVSGDTGIVVTNGQNGDVTIGLDAKYGLRQDCAVGKVLKWDGSAWACATDNDTQYSAGTGLEQSGTQFSIAPDYRVKNTPDCDSGEFATGFGSSGDVQCAAPPSAAGVQAYSARSGYFALGGEDTTVLSKSLPAGTYLLVASVELTNRDSVSQGGFSIGSCSMPGYTTGSNVVRAQASQVTGSASLSLSSVIAHPGGAVELKCSEEEADIDVLNATLTAIKVGSLG